jgi:Na+/melibiose symporter-like transporter
MYYVPTRAFGAELSPDYHERSSLFVYRLFFILGGTLLGSVLLELL